MIFRACLNFEAVAKGTLRGGEATTSDEQTRRSKAASKILDILYNRDVTRYSETSGFDVRDHLTDEESPQHQAAQQVEFEALLGTTKAIEKVVIEAVG